MAKFQCSVCSCVRTIEGPKTKASFLIERTCTYAKIRACNLGHARIHRHNIESVIESHNKTKLIDNISTN